MKLTLVTATLGLLATPLVAQMPGNPVYYSPKHGTGLSLNGDFGRGLNDASGKTNYFGARAVLGLPFITLSAGGGYLDATEGDVTFGATAAINVLSAPFMPIAVGVQAGVGYLSQTIGGADVTTLNIPIGAVLAVKPPTPGLSVEVWGAPRIHVSRTSSGGASSTEARFGGSAGVNLGLPTGLGLHAAVDFVDAPAAAASDPVVVGIGVHYKFTIPGLGMVGM